MGKRFYAWPFIFVWRCRVERVALGVKAYQSKEERRMTIRRTVRRGGELRPKGSPFRVLTWLARASLNVHHPWLVYSDHACDCIWQLSCFLYAGFLSFKAAFFLYGGFLHRFILAAMHLCFQLLRFFPPSFTLIFSFSTKMTYRGLDGVPVDGPAFTMSFCRTTSKIFPAAVDQHGKSLEWLVLHQWRGSVSLCKFAAFVRCVGSSMLQAWLKNGNELNLVVEA